MFMKNLFDGFLSTTDEFGMDKFCDIFIIIK